MREKNNNKRLERKLYEGSSNQIDVFWMGGGRVAEESTTALWWKYIWWSFLELVA